MQQLKQITQELMNFSKQAGVNPKIKSCNLVWIYNG